MKRVILSGFLALAAGLGLNAALTKDFYAARSVLAQGNWVKVGVEETGVYEISYETLRLMGFSNPEKVGVYGRGGTVCPESFVTNAGVPVLTDDLKEVKVLHEDGKLYFYGLGPADISFDSSVSTSLGGLFKRNSNNIYTRRGYYFLTDSRAVGNMTVQNYTSNNTSLTQGVSFIYHELDSVQNSTQSGQLFWGEKIGKPLLPRRTWDVTMPDAIPGSKAQMQCEIYIDPEEGDFDSPDAKVSFGFEGTKGYFQTPYVQPSALYYAPHNPSVAEVEIPGPEGKVFVEFDTPDGLGFSNLDFWVVTYPAGVPTLANGVNQQLIAFPSLGKNTTGQMTLDNVASLVALDVTTPASPQKLTINQKGTQGVVGVRNTGKIPVVIVFDKMKPQKQISGFEKAYYQIENQDLHSYKNIGTDFLIVTVPSLKPYAEEIAALHRQYDGIEVLVVTTEQCYNEFSCGVPDPMGIRSFARMLYMSDRKPKNILLLGPLYSDFRGLQSERDPMEGIIAYQSPSISVARGAHNINDFYGMMGDKFRTDYYERNEVHIGIGILPVKFGSEAKIVVEKIRNYLQRTDHAYYLNRYMAISGLGDNHAHDVQIRDIGNFIGYVDNSATLFTPMAIDTYGTKEAQKKFFNQLNEGMNIFSYFGHGAEQFLGKDGRFFNAGDVFKLRNKVLPLALFGGCQITNTDRGFRGLGETLVTATPYGAIGSIVSGRDTWSGQNYEFFKQFFTCLYIQGAYTTDQRRQKAATIGEVYANVKNYSTYSNELAYQLLADPALVFPVANRSVQASPSGSSALLPGEKYAMTGTIINTDGSVDSNFNGELVLRLCEPDKTLPAGMLETKEDPSDLEYLYRDSQIAMQTAEVKDGRFSIEFHVPGTASLFTGKNLNIYICAYDPSTRIGAGRRFVASVSKQLGGSTESKDVVAPVVEQLEFNPRDCTISLTVSDNLALNLSSNPLNKGMALYVDGKERSEAHFVEPMIEMSRPAYSKNVLIDNLTYGQHSARLKVKDAAGNTAEKEIIFTYNPTQARYVILRDESSNSDSTVIAFEGEAPVSATLVVLSAEGNEIFRSDFIGNSVKWDHVNLAGARVAPGHYKAYILETGGSALKGHSEPIDIPVI